MQILMKPTQAAGVILAGMRPVPVAQANASNTATDGFEPQFKVKASQIDLARKDTLM